MAYTTIDNPEKYFQVKLYTSDGGDDTVITYDGSEDMAPNLVWIKDRSSATSSYVCDSVRGSTKRLRSDGTNAEATETTAVKSFGSDGFTLGTHGAVNSNTSQYATWNWKAGTTGSGTTGGSGTGKAYSYSVSTDAGFSIIAYVGNGTDNHQVSHHLGAVPKMFIMKNRSTTGGWNVYHHTLGASNGILLNTTDASGNDGSMLNNVEPTSVYVNLGDSSETNQNDNNHIMYAFAEKQGYSKFGSYTGNGNADGTFIYTGFKPAFVICKRSDATEGWMMIDNKRANSFNPVQGFLRPNGSNAENDSLPCDFNANGFKWRSTDGLNNTSGGNYIYMAFAENPFVTGSSGVPATAR